MHTSGYGPDDLEKLSDYDTVVIDAQFFSAEVIGKFKAEGHEVISYINIGSIEDWRDYYEDYSDLTLGEYEHWEEEVWPEKTGCNVYVLKKRDRRCKVAA